MNTMTKMRRTNAKAKAHLERQGYMVWLTPHTRFSKDVWGLFDGMAVRRDELCLLQIKSGRLPSCNPFEAFKARFPCINVRLMAWKGSRKGQDIWQERRI